MDTPSIKEDHISQIPALKLMQKLGYILPYTEVFRLTDERNEGLGEMENEVGKTTSVTDYARMLS